ncbi:MAG TPA: hypothetical protein PLS36_08105, partial [Clostridia bacterium]|nr:hypothetical protein [Clostridia bacterium]
MKMNLYSGFKTEKDPETGRRLIRLTEWDAFCYPLYYFIPSVTDDERFLVYHRCNETEVQLWVLNLQTGEHRQLTHASNNANDAQWRPWCSPCKNGVLDHRSVLNTVNNNVIFFDQNIAIMINIETLEQKNLFTLPQHRYPISQNCVTSDGKWFVFSHM